MDQHARHLAFERACSLRDRGDRVGGTARADRAGGERGQARVAMAHHHVVGVDAELGSRDLGHGGLVALALRGVTLEDQHLATRIDAHGDDTIAWLVLERHEDGGGHARKLRAAGKADADM